MEFIPKSKRGPPMLHPHLLLVQLKGLPIIYLVNGIYTLFALISTTDQHLLTIPNQGRYNAYKYNIEDFL